MVIPSQDTTKSGPCGPGQVLAPRVTREVAAGLPVTRSSYVVRRASDALRQPLASASHHRPPASSQDTP